MTRSIINILDNDCIATSPCKNCHWHIQGIEKNRCVKSCQKLKAYREGHEYNHLPWPKLEELQGAKETKDKITPENKKRKAKLSDTLQKNRKNEDSMPKIEKTSVRRNEDDIDGIVDEYQKVCVICHDPDKKILNKRSQTCAACYQAWNAGKIDHPTLGSFKPSLTKSKIKTAKKAGYSIPKPKKPNRDRVFKLYMSEYPGIMSYITEVAEESLLPEKDVFVQLLAESIIARKGKANK